MVIQLCWDASSAVSRFSGSTSSNERTSALASSDTPDQSTASFAMRAFRFYLMPDWMMKGIALPSCCIEPCASKKL